MSFNEGTITKAIVEEYFRRFTENLSPDVAVVGAGPSGLVAAHYLARAGVRTVVFEAKLSVGGGIWGGGMLFNQIVVQPEAKEILDEFEIKYKTREDGLLAVDAVHLASGLAYRVTGEGVPVFNGITVEDLVVRQGRVAGLVLNWTPVLSMGLHVDPLAVEARAVLDATGHDASVVRALREKAGVRLATPTGDLMGERPMWAQRGEREVVENTREVYPGLWVSGMAANAVYGANRMGPIFGGMLLSGRRAAELILRELGKGV